MFKNNIRYFLLSLICGFFLISPKLGKAQTLNQYIIASGYYSNATFYFSNTDFDLGPTVYASSGLPLTYTSSNPAVATIVGGNKIHPVSVGSFELTLSQPGDATYNPAPEHRIMITFVQGIQTITFPAIPSKSVSDVDFDPGATSDSGLPITYTSSNPAVATIVANKIHIVGMGSSNITASQAGNANFEPAANVMRTLTVSPNTQTITFNDINKKYLDPNFIPTATASSGLFISYFTSSNPAVAQVINNSTVKIIGVGTATLTAYQLGNVTYQGASATATLTVTKADQTLLMTSTMLKNFDSPDYNPGAAASSNLPATYTSSNPAVATIVANKVHITGVGDAIITANQAGDALYNAAAPVSQALTVIKANQTITFPNLAAIVLGAPDYDPGATASSGLPITYTSSNPAVATIVANKIHIVGLGVTNITVSQAGDANNNPATSITKSLTVSGSIQVITFPPIPPKTLGDADFNPGATASSGLSVTYSSDNPSVATIVSNKIHLVGAGTAIITAEQAGNSTYAGATATATLTVTKKTQDITFNPMPAKLRSDPDFNPGATASSGLAVTYASSDPAIAIIVDNQVRFMKAGTVVITASQAGDDIYLPATDVNQTLTVNKGVQVVSFPIISPKNMFDADFDPGSTSNSGLPTVYTSSNMSVAIPVAGHKIQLVGVGTTIITSTQAGDSDYEPASASRALNVIALTQVINFPPIPSAALSTLDFDPGATINSGLPIIYTSSNTAVATIVANKIHIVGEGSTTITASQPGNVAYLPAQSKVQTLIVGRSNQSITFTVLPIKALGDADFSPGASASSGLPITYTSSNPAVATIVGGLIKINGVGTTTIQASQGGDANYYAATPVARALTVTGNAVQTITFPALVDKPFGSTSYSPGAISNSGLVVTYTSSDPAVAVIINNNIHLTGVGTTTITASQSGNDTFAAAATVSQPLNVIKGTAVINFLNIPNQPMNQADFVPYTTNVANLPVTFTSSDPMVATIVSGKVHLTGVGTATITASHAGNANYNPASANQNLTVTKGFQIITFPALATTVPSAPDFDPGATVNSGLAITYTSSDPTVATIVGGNIHITGLGTTTITASQAGDANYNAAANVSRTLTVSKGNQTITFPLIPAKPLATADFDPGATVNSGLPITYTSSNPAVATIVAGNIHIVGLGSTTITASQPGDANYNPANQISRLLYISPTTQYITVAPTITKTFGIPDFDLGAVSSSGLETTMISSDPSIASIVENKVRLNRVGSVIITTVQYGNAAYSGATAITNLIITKANQTINFPALADRRTGDPNFPAGASASSGLTVFYTSNNPAVATIIGNLIHIVGPGNAEIIASQPGDINYNIANTVTQVLTVLKGEQTITFPDIVEKSLTDTDFNPGATASSGLAITYTSSNPAVATIVNGNIHIVGIGNTIITASQAGNSAYSPAISVSKTLTVRGYAQVITFNPIPNKKLTDADFDPGATVDTSLPITYSSSNTAVATIVNGKIHIVGGGTTTITATQAGDATYAPISASVTLTVDKYTQTITFPAISAKELNAADFDPGATASSGLAVTYTSTDANVATIVGNKVHIVGAGTTTITANQSGNNNFAAADPVTVTLVINKGSQTISFAAIPVKTYNDADFDLSATASSGLSVSYSSSNPAVATVTGNKVHIIASGSTVITASQAGNNNYNAAANVTQTLDVVYTLPNNNFTVKATDVSCRGSSNGAINIAAVSSMNYTATITGNGRNITQNFNTALAVPNLTAGTYTVVITVAGQPGFSHRSEVTVKEPKDLAVYSSIKDNGNSVLLKLEGGDSYRIELNGKVYTTGGQEITLPLVKGNNVLRISSDKVCQGVIERSILTSNTVSLYPNPVRDILTINTGSLDTRSVKVDIAALDGRLVHSSQQTAEYGQVKVDMSKLNRGMYVLTLTVGNTKTVHKVVKN